MLKVFHFDCPEPVYTADACVITCIDARFDLAIRKFLKRRGVLVFDHIKIPGSVQALASPRCESDREFVLRLVRMSLAAHRPPRALLIGHSDCAAYPGAAGDAITADLTSASEVLQKAEPSLDVECYFAAFDGIYEVTKVAATS